MVQLEQKFKDVCEREPQKKQSVVITLKSESAHLKASDLGLASGEDIGDLGIIKADLSGNEVLTLCERSEVEEITPDFGVDIL